LIQIVAVENHKNPAIDSLCQEYIKRLQTIHPVSIQLLAAAKVPDPQQQKIKETESVLKLVKPGDTLILCDERGKTTTSPAFSKWLETQLSQSRGKIIFAIGGAYGFTEQAIAQYPGIKLSDWVFPHHIARLVLIEQIYRAFQIQRGTGYHHI